VEKKKKVEKSWVRGRSSSIPYRKCLDSKKKSSGGIKKAIGGGLVRRDFQGGIRHLFKQRKWSEG